MKFKTQINLKATLEAGLGGFITAYLLGLPLGVSVVIGVFCAVSGSYTDIRGFLRQQKADQT